MKQQGYVPYLHERKCKICNEDYWRPILEAFRYVKGWNNQQIEAYFQARPHWGVDVNRQNLSWHFRHHCCLESFRQEYPFYFVTGSVAGEFSQ